MNYWAHAIGLKIVQKIMNRRDSKSQASAYRTTPRNLLLEADGRFTTSSPPAHPGNALWPLGWTMVHITKQQQQPYLQRYPFFCVEYHADWWGHLPRCQTSLLQAARSLLSSIPSGWDWTCGSIVLSPTPLSVASCWLYVSLCFNRQSSSLRQSEIPSLSSS